MAATHLVLGIDSAWTANNPSGVCLAETDGHCAKCRLVGPSYDQFIEGCEATPVDWSRQPSGGELDVPRLLKAIQKRFGMRPTVVAVDMPLSLERITSRRQADNKISSEFGSRHCSTHSPGPTRPGPISDRLTSEFQIAGYHLRTSESGQPNSLLEVYPHVSILKLMDLPDRYLYKLGKKDRSGLSKPDRIQRAIQNFEALQDHLERDLGPLGFSLPTDSHTFSSLKRYEDALDSAVCAWTAVQYLREACRGVGDETAAIWIPR